ncbi:glycosyl transferase [Bryobacterales bacterium F-183]|nr:glycosyl transferase [Bryobacterales bacterium F-183]
MITAVIPNYNGAARLQKLLPQLQRELETAGRILVVDGNSSDGSVSLCQSLGVPVLQLPANLGFARAVNAGIEQSLPDSEWIGILNNDITIELGFFSTLLNQAKDGVWFLAPRILSAADPTLIDGTYDLPTRAGTAYRAGAGRPYADSPFQHPRDIHCAPMTAALFRSDLFRELGTLDDDFGSYLEDVDFGIRCIAAGRKGRYVPDAVAYHEGSATLGGAWSARSTRWISRNQLVLVRKHGFPFWPAVAGQTLWGLLALRRGRLLSWAIGKLEGFFTNVKSIRHQNPDWLVLNTEREIDELQRHHGYDWYWRQYFRFAPLPPEDQNQ